MDDDDPAKRQALDDAMTEALWALRNKQHEYIGVAYDNGGVPVTLPPQSAGSSDRAKGRFSIPGPLLGIYHNHPLRMAHGRDLDRADFTPEDKGQALRLGVPSYVGAGTEVWRYAGDGAATQVLAQFPWEAQKKEIMDVLGRDIDDTRGIKR